MDITGHRQKPAAPGELLRTTLDAAGDQLATTGIGGRAVAVVAGRENRPPVVGLAIGAVEPLPGDGGGVQALTIAGP